MDGATATAYLDGARTNGFLSTSWFMAGDVGGQTEPLAPSFEEGTSLRIPSGTPLLLRSAATEAHAGLIESYDQFSTGESLPIDLASTGSTVDGEPGRHLLAVDVFWRNGTTGYGQDGTEERAVFFFSVEIVNEQDPPPPPSETPSPERGPTDAVTIDIRRTSEETGDPEAVARFGSQETWMCPDGWSVVNPDGTTDEITFDCGQDDVFEAPVGTPINVSGDFASVNATARLSGSDDRTSYPANAVPAIDAGSVVFYQFEVSWDDGSEASFWLLLTVKSSGSPSSVHTAQIVVKVFGVGERAYEQPTATFSFDGQTETACTESWEWLVGGGQTDGGEAFCSGGPAIGVPPGTPIAIEAATTTRVSTTRTTTPFFEGNVWLVVNAEWAEGTATFIMPLSVDPSTPDLELVVLDCRPGDQVSITPPENRIEPAGSAYIVGNIPGFEQSDTVEQMTREEGSDAGDLAGVWQVVRDGTVVASVDYPELSGTACTESGIGEP